MQPTCFIIRKIMSSLITVYQNISYFKYFISPFNVQIMEHFSSNLFLLAHVCSKLWLYLLCWVSACISHILILFSFPCPPPLHPAFVHSKVGICHSELLFGLTPILTLCCSHTELQNFFGNISILDFCLNWLPKFLSLIFSHF